MKPDLSNFYLCNRIYLISTYVTGFISFLPVKPDLSIRLFYQVVQISELGTDLRSGNRTGDNPTGSGKGGDAEKGCGIKLCILLIQVEFWLLQDGEVYKQWSPGYRTGENTIKHCEGSGWSRFTKIKQKTLKLLNIKS